jgi:hypothetical protein
VASSIAFVQLPFRERQQRWLHVKRVGPARNGKLDTERIDIKRFLQAKVPQKDWLHVRSSIQ